MLLVDHAVGALEHGVEVLLRLLQQLAEEFWKVWCGLEVVGYARGRLESLGFYGTDKELALLLCVLNKVTVHDFHLSFNCDFESLDRGD